ncbi:MAG: hypothetical protein HQL90_14665 [Magnetococcales bacterium]|nr:hypothetical protein [Magnetococcales bacterium]
MDMLSLDFPLISAWEAFESLVVALFLVALVGREEFELMVVGAVPLCIGRTRVG